VPDGAVHRGAVADDHLLAPRSPPAFRTRHQPAPAKPVGCGYSIAGADLTLAGGEPHAYPIVADPNDPVGPGRLHGWERYLWYARG
jgi:hypothetical protein